ncbi:FecR family protein [Fulvitalea axinellae]
MEGSLNAKEEEELWRWLNSNRKNQDVFESRISLTLEGKPLPEGVLSEREALSDVKKRIVAHENRHVRLWWRRSAIASAVVLLVLLGFFSQEWGDRGDGVLNVAGSENVILTLSDGNEVALTENVSRLEDVKGKGFVGVWNGKSLSYQANGFQSLSETFNTVRVPSGKRFSITLSDGSQIEMNSETELRYPVVFKGNERNIELLSGEIYCKIAKNKHKPFYVNSSRLRLRVLGTSFNFSAYQNERKSSAVLVEGSVGIIPRNDVFDIKKAILLDPGEALVYDKMIKKVVKSKVRVADYTAWKDGKLIFKTMPLNELLLRLGRWYGVRIEDRTGRGDSYTYSGTFDEESIEEALDALSKLCDFNFRLTDNGVVVE